MGKFLKHAEKTVSALAIWLAIHDDKIWASISEIEQAAYGLEAWELLDYLVVLEVIKVDENTQWGNEVDSDIEL